MAVKPIRWLVRLLLLVLFVGFAVANRHAVTVSFDPLPLAWPVPLFLVVFAAMFIGFLAGGGVAWLRGSRWRQRARQAESEQRKSEQERSTGTALSVPDAAH